MRKGEGGGVSLIVIASEAKQSSAREARKTKSAAFAATFAHYLARLRRAAGLLRRFAPRNDGKPTPRYARAGVP